MITHVDGAMRFVARRLESAPSSFSAGFRARWPGVLPIVRRLEVSPRVRVLTVGGATLGGSGKTPLAIACAKALREGGARVAFVGHGYRAHARGPALVSPGDSSFGDEAEEAARALVPFGVMVFAAARRERAVELASTRADVLVLDGPVNLEPRRADAALLAVDPEAPYGSGRCFPFGDLRAAPERLRAAVDRIVRVGAGEAAEARIVALRARTLSGEESPVSSHRRVATGIARPGRFLEAVQAAGATIELHLERPDHDVRPLPEGPWLVPAKNAHWAWGSGGRRARADVAWVEYDIDLPSSLRDFLNTRLLR